LAEVKWIKLLTEMFDDEKIKLIEAVPEADMILVIWIKLLTLAGKKNMNGYIFLTENIPYTDEMLATLFNRPLNTIRLALETFKKFGMIEFNGEGQLKITNWEKHQNIEGLEKIREQARLRQEKHRAKLLPLNNPSLKELEKDREEKNREDKSRESRDSNVTSLCEQIIYYLNTEASKNFQVKTPVTMKLIKARLKEGFTLDDFKRVIDVKTEEWKGRTTKDGKNMEDWLRPQTLFSNKFESYLNQTNTTHDPNRFDFINEEENQIE